MPQMKPMNWLIIFLMLNLILLMINIMNYFFIYINMMKKNNYKKSTMNFWKW